jgi:hypothetical protein
MKLAIVGSRTFRDYPYFENIVNKFRELNHIDEIVSGGAIGTDDLAEIYAHENNISLKIFYPEWGKYGKSAGYIRNKLIIEYADEVMAFWDGQSKGTKHDIDIAKELNKMCHIIGV